MLKRFFNYISDVIVGKGVEDVFTRLAIGDEIVLSKDLQLMGYGGFRHSQQACNIADAHRLAVYGKENAGTGRVAENLEEVGQLVQSGLVGHRRPLTLNYLAVYLLALAGGGGDFIMLH